MLFVFGSKMIETILYPLIEGGLQEELINFMVVSELNNEEEDES